MRCKEEEIKGGWRETLGWNKVLFGSIRGGEFDASCRMG